MDAYELYEARQIQERSNLSAADALSMAVTSAVPAGKVWTILSGHYHPSAAETQTVQWQIISRSNTYFPVTVPVSVALSATILFPIVTEGMEIKLYPGEMIRILRGVATAGSTMTAYIRFIESDLPFQGYIEQLKPVVRTSMKHGAVYRATGGVSSAPSGGGTPPPAHGATGGGGGGAEPV